VQRGKSPSATERRRVAAVAKRSRSFAGSTEELATAKYHGPHGHLGVAAETAVAAYVQGLGWEVLERNLRVGPLELDVVARDGATVVVIEVRCRGSGSWTSGFGSLSPTKRLRVRRAGEKLWHTRFRCDKTIDRMRFDAASVQLDRNGRAHIEYAMAAF
jgi:putative endonuclease